jgi:hypothetical protein
MRTLRSLAVTSSLLLAILGTVATSDAAPAGLTAESNPVEVTAGPGATVTLVGEVAVTGAEVSGGTVGLNIDIDPNSSGSVTITLSANGRNEVVDIVDAATQGQTRIATDIFSSCTSTCTEGVSVSVVRTDDAVGELQAILVLDGSADAADPALTGGSLTTSLRLQ